MEKADNLGITFQELETYLQHEVEDTVKLLYKLKDLYREEVSLYQVYMEKVHSKNNRKLQATIDDRFSRRLGLIMSMRDLEQLLYDRFNHELGVDWESIDIDYISPWN